MSAHINGETARDNFPTSLSTLRRSGSSHDAVAPSLPPCFIAVSVLLDDAGTPLWNHGLGMTVMYVCVLVQLRQAVSQSLEGSSSHLHEERNSLQKQHEMSMKRIHEEHQKTVESHVEEVRVCVVCESYA